MVQYYENNKKAIAVYKTQYRKNNKKAIVIYIA